MDAIKIKKLLRLAFILVDISFIGGIIDLYVIIFPGLNNLFSIFTLNVSDLGSANSIIDSVPVWPFILMVVTIFLFLCFAVYLYKYVWLKIQAQSIK